jgi:ribose transport system ATP-binding protein
MVGRSLAAKHDLYTPDLSSRRELFRAEGLCSDSFTGVDLEVAPGEIVGIYGKVGSGVPELAAAIFGAYPLTEGSLFLDGSRVTIADPAAAIRHGIGYLSGDRASEGLLGPRSVAENLAAPSWRRLAAGWGWITATAERRAFAPWHKTLRVRSRPDGSERITTLSGGNQQKVLLGRWLEAKSRLLVLTEPTRGVDVGARQEIYQVLRDLARAGHGIIVATSDYEDVTEVATRAMIMVRGRIVAEIPQPEISTASLTHAAGGGVHVSAH